MQPFLHDGDFVPDSALAECRLALSALRNVTADLAIVDISLCGANGLELIKNLKAEHPKIPILVLSVHDEKEYAPRALRAGASAYVMKTEAADFVLRAVRAVLDGQITVSPAMRERLITGLVRGSASSPVDALSDRELEVLQLIGEGRSSNEIADVLTLSVKTVESHRLHIREKLKLENSGQIVRFALERVQAQQASVP
jgi:DNA-binding NarL/FixJ family response regulator